MPIRLVCEACGSALRAPDGSSGRKGECPSCGVTLRIGVGEGWYYRELLGSAEGPVLYSELAGLARSGVIGPYTRVWQSPDGAVTLARNVPGLFTEAPSPAPASPCPG
jgi:GYF domain 2